MIHCNLWSSLTGYLYGVLEIRTLTLFHSLLLLLSGVYLHCTVYELEGHYDVISSVFTDNADEVSVRTTYCWQVVLTTNQ
jgi:hypothetical protein